MAHFRFNKVAHLYIDIYMKSSGYKKRSFFNFENNLFESYEFLKKHKDLMYYDEQGRSHEILVTSRSIDYGVSVQTNGKDVPESCMVISKTGLFE